MRSSSTAASSSRMRCASGCSRSCGTGTTAPDIAVAAAGADQSVARPGRGLGGRPTTPGCGTPAAGASAAASRGRTTSASKPERRSRRSGNADACSAWCRSAWKKGRRSSWRSRNWSWPSVSRCCFRCTPPRSAATTSRAICWTCRRSNLLQLPPLHTILRGGKRSGVKQRAGHAGGTLHRDRHAGALLRRQGRQQSLAAGVQRPRHRRDPRTTRNDEESRAAAV